LRDGARAFQSRTFNKQTISEKIPSLFAFLARVPRMRHTVFVCRFMQMLRTKMKMKNIPGVSRSNIYRKSNHAVEESMLAQII
jgi:hypothetical protein